MLVGGSSPFTSFWGSKDNLSPGQFGTADNMAPSMLTDNLAPGQFGTADNLAPGKIGTADNLAPQTIWQRGQFGTGQFGTMCKTDILTPRTI